MGRAQIPDPFHFIKSDLVASAVVKLCGAGRFVSGDCLGVLDCAAVFQIRSNSGCSKGMAARGVGESRAGCPPFDHAEHIGASDRIHRERTVLVNATEEGPFFSSRMPAVSM
jgi:hypothetical protein